MQLRQTVDFFLIFKSFVLERSKNKEKLKKNVAIKSRLIVNYVFSRKYSFFQIRRTRRSTRSSSGHVEVRFTTLPKKRRHNSKTFCSCSRSFQFWARRVQLPQPCRKFFSIFTIMFWRKNEKYRWNYKFSQKHFDAKIFTGDVNCSFHDHVEKKLDGSPKRITQIPKSFCY